MHTGQSTIAPSPAEPPSPELLAAAGVAGPRQALQAECRQGSSRGSRSGRKRSRHTPQCSKSSCASPPPPAGDDADAEAAAAEEAAGRFSPPAEPSPDPGLPEAAEAAVAAEAAAVAAAAEAAIHTPPGGWGGRPGEEGHRARCAGASALAANGQAAADAARPSAATRLLGRRPPRPRRCRDAAKPLAAGLSTDDGAATRAASSLAAETRAARIANNRPTARRSQKEPRPGGGTEISGADDVAHARWAPQPGGGAQADYARARALPSTRSRPSRSRIARLPVGNSPAEYVRDVSHAHRTVHRGLFLACWKARVAQNRTLGPASLAGVATSAAAAWPIVREEGRDNPKRAEPRLSTETEPRWRG